MANCLGELHGRQMSETPAQSKNIDSVSPPQAAAITPQPRRSAARRLGCGLALLFWFTALLTPCALFYLASHGEIRLNHREIPQSHAHPLLLVSLVSEAEDRGLRIETSWNADSDSDVTMLCVQTSVRFLLWEYSGGNQNVNYCDCYTRQDADAIWEYVKTYGGAC